MKPRPPRTRGPLGHKVGRVTTSVCFDADTMRRVDDWADVFGATRSDALRMIVAAAGLPTEARAVRAAQTTAARDEAVRRERRIQREQAMRAWRDDEG